MKIDAYHTVDEHKNANPQKCQQLVKELYLAVGARVRVTYNGWVEEGITNGAMGTVRDFVYSDFVDGGDPNRIEVVMVELDKYEGTAFFEQPELRKVIPFSRIDPDIDVPVKKGDDVPKRVQFPLRLAYALQTFWLFHDQVTLF